MHQKSDPAPDALDVRVSKFLSLLLRHHPERIGITLDEAGWTDIAALLTALGAAGMPLSRAGLDRIVATSPKKRFAYSEDGMEIRASQGHSVPVALAYSPGAPPPVLYHGTAVRNLPSIREQGIVKGARHHVHLSTDAATARQVGSRHGSPVVLQVDAAAMEADGYLFFCSENGVWLTDAVPPKYLAEGL